jgi:hypothetical protein
MGDSEDGAIPAEIRDLRHADVLPAVAQPRLLRMHEVLRYPATPSQAEERLDGLLNFHFVTAGPPSSGLETLQLSRGIWATRGIDTVTGPRRGVLAIRSTPWNAGGVFNPWHDDFDLAHGHVHYFGDHRANTMGLPGATLGNRLLLQAWELHSGTHSDERMDAAPILIFRSCSAVRDGRRQVKGQVEFCGVGLIERLEHVVQRDPQTDRSFPNIVIDLAVVDLADEGDTLDMRWIDARRNSTVSASKALSLAPKAWKRWVKEGRSAIPRIRRRPLSSRVKSPQAQLPERGTPQARTLELIYRTFENHRHPFELLAAKVAASIMGGKYTEGWLTRPGGDGGVDFVGRLDVGSSSASTPIVILGQAKCVGPAASINADQVARVVARLRRGWIGVYVTTGHFTERAQVEIVDDQYPLVLVPGQELAECVDKIAQEDFGGDLTALFASVLQDYQTEITNRRPEEILNG